MRVEFASLAARHPAAREDAPPALKPLTLSIAAGEQVAIIGPSGAGKTTLLHALACALKPATGGLQLDGVDPWSLSVRSLQRLRGRLFLAPHVPPLPPRQRVITAVLAARLPRQSLWQGLRSLVYPEDIGAAHTALAAFDLSEKLWERVDRLSGGERQRVALARALLAPASLWLIDEPLSALDPTRARQAVDTLVDEAQARGVTLIATLHQVDVALERFPRIVGLMAGQVAFDLPAGEVTREMLAQLYGSEFEQLNEPPGATAASPDATTRQPVVVHCR